MQFKKVIGNENLKKQLTAMVDNTRVSHAMMLEEDGITGALALALGLVQYMSCTSRVDENGVKDSCGDCPTCRKIEKLIHPDLHFVFPVNVTAKSGSERKPTSDHFIGIWRKLVIDNPYFTESSLNRALGIEDKVGIINVVEAKDILAKMNMSSYEGGNKYVIIWLPERMNIEAANRLLKIVEEPFPNTYFIFISQSPERVINTIRSRCLRIPVLPIDTSLIQSSETVESPYLSLIISLLENILTRNLVAIIKDAETMAELGREKQKEFCIFSEAFIRKIMMVKQGVPQIVYNGDISKYPEGKAVLDLASKLPEEFFEKAFRHLESARLSIESNVNAKMVFCNLGNLFFMSL